MQSLWFVPQLPNPTLATDATGRQVLARNSALVSLLGGEPEALAPLMGAAASLCASAEPGEQVIEAGGQWLRVKSGRAGEDVRILSVFPATDEVLLRYELEQEGPLWEQFLNGEPLPQLLDQVLSLVSRLQGNAAAALRYVDENGQPVLHATSTLPSLYKPALMRLELPYEAASFRQTLPGWETVCVWTFAFSGTRDGAMFVVRDSATLPTLEALMLERLARIAHLLITSARLEGERALLLRVAEQTTEGILIADRNRNAVWCNPAMEDLTGYSMTELKGRKPGSMLQGPRTDRETRTLLREKLDAGEAVSVRILNYHKSGAWYWNWLRIAPMVDESGALTGFISIQKDVTQEVEREEALRLALKQAEEASRLKSAFLANVSHEIRTPLNGIIGLADVLQFALSEQNEPALVEYASLILESGERLARLLTDLIDQSRIESNELKLHLRPVAIGELTAKVVGLMEPLALKKGLDIGLSYQGGLHVQADEDRLHQVLVNLMSNAIKFTDLGKIRVRITERLVPNRRVEIVVQDTGRGIPPDFMPHIFTPFRQASDGLSRTHEGAGLGLSIAKMLVERMGGTLTVESIYGKGATFTVSLPVA